MLEPLFKHKTRHQTILSYCCLVVVVMAGLQACSSKQQSSSLQKPSSNALALPDATKQAVINTNAQEDQKLPVDEQIIKGELENGLGYIIRQNDKPESFAELRLVIKTGSIFEDESQLGFAHFAEHMAFNGTEDFKEQEIVEFVESIGMRFGAHLNASTTFDHTIYKLRVPTTEPEVIEKAIHVLENWAHKVSFNAKAIDDERGVVLEEWRGRKGVGERIAKQQWPLIFDGTNYAQRLPIGTEQNITQGKHEDLIRFYKTWYRPDLMSVIAVGDFDAKKVESLIKRYFSPIQNPKAPVKKPIQFLTQFDKPVMSTFTDKELTGINLSMTWRNPIALGEISLTGYRQKVIQGLVTGILSKRLNDKSLDTESAFVGARLGLSSAIPTSQEFFIRAGVKPKQTAKALVSLLSEVQRANEHGVTKQEFETEKRLYLEWFESLLESQNTLSHSAYLSGYIQHFLNQTPLISLQQDYQLTKSILPTLSTDDLHQQIQTWVNHENTLVFITAPDNMADHIPTEPALQQLWTSTKNTPTSPFIDKEQVTALMSTLPEPGRVVDKRFIEHWQAHQWTLSNGVRVIVKPTLFKENSIRVRAISDGGYATIDDETYLATFGMMDTLAYLGLGDLNMEQLTQFSREKRFSTTPSVNEYSEGLRGGSNKEDLLYMMQSIYLRFTQPVKDTARFEWLKTTFRPRLENKYNSPNAQFFAAIQEKTQAGNPRNVEFDVNMLDKQSIDLIYDVYKARFANAADFTFVFVGDIDLTKMETLVNRYIASLPANETKETRQALDEYKMQGEYEIHMQKGAEPKATVIMSLFGDAMWTAQNQLLTSALRSALETTLRNRLREELAGVYSVRVNASLSRWPYQNYALNVSFTCDPERIEELHHEVQSIFKKFSRGDIDPQLLDNYKKQTITAREKSLKENDFWLNYMLLHYTPFTPLPIEQFVPLVNSLNMELLKKTAKQYLITDNTLFATLKPEKTELVEGK